LQLVNESYPSRIFLANPSIDRKLYAEAFHLNDTDLELLESLIPSATCSSSSRSIRRNFSFQSPL
jgi:hypothetical protein